MLKLEIVGALRISIYNFQTIRNKGSIFNAKKIRKTLKVREDCGKKKNIVRISLGNLKLTTR